MSGNTSKRYPPELKERAVRMAGEIRGEHESDWAAMVRVAELLGVSIAETVRKWCRQAQVDAGTRPGTTLEEAAEIKRLKRENAELRRANAILNGCVGFLRGRARPAREAVTRFITEHKDHQESGPNGKAGLTWGVEPMCAVLSEHGVKISPSTYYEWVNKQPTKRQLADAELVAVIRGQREDKRLITIEGVVVA